MENIMHLHYQPTTYDLKGNNSCLLWDFTWNVNVKVGWYIQLPLGS